MKKGGAGCAAMAGGKRRSRKSTKRGGGNCSAMAGGKRRRSRKMRGGNFYGVGEPITPGAIEYRAVENSGPLPGGQIPSGDIAPGKMTGASRRKKGRRGMRGGASQVPAMRANSGFTGEGTAGLADYRDVGTVGRGGNPY